MQTCVSTNELLEFQNKLRKYALRKRRSREEAEDIASFGVMQVLSGSIPNLHYRYVDYLRDKYSKIEKNSENISEATYRHVSLEALSSVSVPADSDNEYRLSYYEKILTPREIQFLRWHTEGYGPREINKMLGKVGLVWYYKLWKVIEAKLKGEFIETPKRTRERKPERYAPQWALWQQLRKKLKN